MEKVWENGQCKESMFVPSLRIFMGNRQITNAMYSDKI